MREWDQSGNLNQACSFNSLINKTLSLGCFVTSVGCFIASEVMDDCDNGIVRSSATISGFASLAAFIFSERGDDNKIFKCNVSDGVDFCGSVAIFSLSYSSASLSAAAYGFGFLKDEDAEICSARVSNAAIISSIISAAFISECVKKIHQREVTVPVPTALEDLRTGYNAPV